MKILLNKSDLSILNKRSLKYNLADAEKDYLLAVISKLIYESSLRDKLVFKGGTAIHHVYLSQSRFSEDLDFTSLDKNVTFEEIKEVLDRPDFLEVQNEFISEATIKIGRLKYTGPLGLSNSVKIDIDRKQNVVLSPKTARYINPWKLNVRVNAMDVREICAEKIRAASGRARYRDFYDLMLLFKRKNCDIKDIVELIKRKEIRKPITQKSMLRNWEIAKREREEEFSRIYYAEEIDEEEIKTLIQELSVSVY